MTNLMKFEEMKEALKEAEILQNRADMCADELARMLVGRLRRVRSGYVLQKLKRELRDYNMTTHNWKD